MPYEIGDEVTTVAGAVEVQDEATRKLLKEARARFKLCVDAENDFRQAALDDLEFLTGKQWPGETLQQRAEENRPCLTINRMPAIVSQIVNEQRSQRPQATIKPVGDGADVEAAEVWEGIVRHIHVNSDSEIAVDCGFEHMTASGKGYCELVADYLPGKTFDQELYIRRIKNPFTVYCDPASNWADESDANFKFKVCDYDYEEYKLEFGKTALATLSDFNSIGDNYPGWGDGETIRVAEYWRKEWDDEQLYHLEDGTIMESSQYNKMTADMPLKPKILKKRKWRKCKIKCSVINAIEEIDSYEFPGNVGYIPLVPFIAYDFDVNGKRELYGIIRNGKDAQRSINYFRSYAAEVIALAPKAPWVGGKGQFKDGKWQNANTVNYAYLEYDVVNTQGGPLPPPMRNQFEPPIQAILAMSQAVDQDLKSVTGIYEPSLGQTKTDQSGKAIDLLQKQGGLTNLNFTDNLSRTLRHIGRIILDAAPFIYDAPRVQRIIKPDGETKHVIVHAGRAKAADALKDEAVNKVYDLSVGTYDVVIDVGPSYQTKRQEAFQMQMQLAQADKTGEIMKAAGDIIVGNSDMPGSKEIAARIKTLVPPQVLAAEDQSDPKVQLQQMQSQLQQAQQVNQQLMQHNAEMMDEIKTEKVKAQKDLEIAGIRAAAQVEAAALSAKIDLARLEFDKWQLAHQTAHEAGLQATQLSADATAQQSDQQHQATQANVQQTHEATQADADREAAAVQPEAGANAGT